MLVNDPSTLALLLERPDSDDKTSADAALCLSRLRFGFAAGLSNFALSFVDFALSSFGVVSGSCVLSILVNQAATVGGAEREAGCKAGAGSAASAPTGRCKESWDPWVDSCDATMIAVAVVVPSI